MELKRILASDTRSANEKALQLYGPNVFVISNQRLAGQTELVVAVDVQAAPPEQEELAPVATNSKPDGIFYEQLQVAQKSLQPKPESIDLKEQTESIQQSNERDLIRSREIIDIFRKVVAQATG